MRKEVARGAAFISDLPISGAEMARFVSQVRAGSPSPAPVGRPLYKPEGSVAIVIGWGGIQYESITPGNGRCVLDLGSGRPRLTV